MAVLLLQTQSRCFRDWIADDPEHSPNNFRRDCTRRLRLENPDPSSHPLPARLHLFHIILPTKASHQDDSASAVHS